MKDKKNNQLLWVVQLAVVTVFLGRAYQFIYWDAPYRTLLWDEVWMGGLVRNLMGMTWEDYSTNLEIDDRIQQVIQATGIFYLIGAVIALWIRRVPKWIGSFLLIGSGFLVFLALLYMKERFFSIGQFFEYSLQFTAPIILYVLAYQTINHDRLIFWMKIAMALTFTCHGLYALNIYPRPGLFTEMTMNILSISESNAIHFLNMAGVMDFVISIAIFLPFRWAKPAIYYGIVWGFLTAIARVWAHFDLSFIYDSLHQWTYEMLLRFPHFLLPLAILMLIQQQTVGDKDSIRL